MILYRLLLSLGLLGLIFSGCASRRNANDRVSTASPAAAENKENAQGSNKSDELITIRSRFLDAGVDSSAVFLLVSAFKNGRPIPFKEFSEGHSLNYVIYADYGARDRQGYGNVSLTKATITQPDGTFLISFKIKKPKRETGVLLSEISSNSSSSKSLNDLPIRFRSLQFRDRYGIFDASGKSLIFNNFIKEGQQVQVKSLSSENAQLQGRFYQHIFDAARSPMNTSAPASTNRELKVDGTLSISQGSPTALKRKGLYYFYSDTSQTGGLGLLVTDDRFPQMTWPNELLGPIQYLSTNQEISAYKDAAAPKKALDKFWLTIMNGNADLARTVIRNFYENVEEANRLFTGYKEGWKTDRGMIFIVLGNPDRVQRSKDKEVWVYDRRGNAKNLVFTFTRKDNQFVGNHYELVRYIEYQQVWFPIVEAWRNGTIR